MIKYHIMIHCFKSFHVFQNSKLYNKILEQITTFYKLANSTNKICTEIEFGYKEDYFLALLDLAKPNTPSASKRASASSSR